MGDLAENARWGEIILFVVDLKTRAVTISGITTSPNESFMAHVARNLTDCLDGFLTKHRFLICDRDTKFTKKFKATLKSAGVKIVRTPSCNAYAERFVLSIKSESLNRMIFNVWNDLAVCSSTTAGLLSKRKLGAEPGESCVQVLARHANSAGHGPTLRWHRNPRLPYLAKEQKKT